ncbi:hypothetical protein DEO72_LG5g1724 [Vigna unguiculata]|uniref:Uncharacterized protein n=1 Tax=Vigna unguiculata TaxID=3917 RepID=A0A4D6LZ72_VIGUN|nr:hypothetical protein DEO72_LG5g1724 [Vigna unguiculata]
MTIRKDIEINMSETLINSIDNMEPNHLVRTRVEFSSKALILGHRVGSLYQRDLKEGNWGRVDEWQGKVDKFAEEKEAGEKEKEEWKEEKRRLGTWKVHCLDLEEKFKVNIADLEADYNELKEKHEGLEVELEDLKGAKDVKKVRAALLGPGSSSGIKGPEAGLIELPKMTIRKDIEINMSETLINSIDNMEPNHLVRTRVEFSSKALILGHRVGSLYQRDLKEGNWGRVDEWQGKVDKFAEEKEAGEKEKEEWKEEKRRLGTWKVHCLDLEEKFKVNIADLEADYNELKEKHEGLEVELEDLKGCIIQELSLIHV